MRNPLSRRALAGAAALLALPVAGAAATTAAEHPDAELLRLGAELDASWAKQKALEHVASEEEFEAIMDVGSNLAARIEHMPAHTLDGILVKARAISWCNSGSEIDPDRFCPYPGATTDGRIAASIVRDLLRRA